MEIKNTDFRFSIQSLLCFFLFTYLQRLRKKKEIYAFQDLSQGKIERLCLCRTNIVCVITLKEKNAFINLFYDINTHFYFSYIWSLSSDKYAQPFNL